METQTKSTNLVGMAIAILVAVLMLGTILVPVITDATHTTITITNEGAGEMKFAYYAEPVDLEMTIVYDSGTSEIIANNHAAADPQTITAVESIVWASDVGAIIFNGESFVLVMTVGETTGAIDLDIGFHLSVVDDVATIIDGDNNEYSATITWSYVPDKDGQFGFFTDSGATVKDFPVAAAGTFAGVYAYNENNSINLATMTHTYSVTDGVFNTGPWTVPDLGAKTVTPIIEEKEVKEIEEKEVKEIEEKTIKAVPTPTYTDGDWGFNLSETNAIIVSYSGAAGNLSIPATVSTGGNSYPVTQVGIGLSNSPVFDNATITGSTITIPNSVTSIGSYAFYKCSGLTGSLTIPDSVETIGSYAFQNCSGLTGSLTIPDSVETIGSYAFQNCSGFTGSLTIPDSVETIGSFAFNKCTGFTGSLTISDSVTFIGLAAFKTCTGFTGSLTISDSVTSLPDSTFQDCTGFTGSLTIPDSVTSIGTSAFQNCSGLTGSLTIPDSVTLLKQSAFQNCSGFTGSLTISDSVTAIGISAFQDCSGFTGSLTIPDSVENISASAFRGCSGFTGPLVIPESVDMVESAAFYGCTGFTGIVIEGSPSFGSYPFTGMTVDVLNLGTTSISPGQYGLAADAVIDDEIPSLGYMAPASFSETVEKEGAAYDLMKIIPVIVVLAVLMMAVTVVIRRD